MRELCCKIRVEKGGKPDVIESMEFLRSFLRCHLAEKPAVASSNVSCFLRLTKLMFPKKMILK